MKFAVPFLSLCAVLQGATGVAEPQLSSFDDFMSALLTKWRISGATLGVSRNGRLILARGYGQDSAGRPIQPDSLFPIGPITQALNQAASLQTAASPGGPDQIRSAILKPLGIERMRVESGEWIGTVGDVLRFANALDGRRPPSLLNAARLQAIFSPDTDWWLSGLFRQAATGVDVAVLFDSPPADAAFDSELKSGIANAANSVRQWPSKDLFFEGPELFARDVLNGADYSGGRVSPGEIVVLYPSNAGPAELAGSQLNGEQRIATVTGDTRVLFDGIPAPMASSVDGRIGAVVPYGVAGHRTTEIVVEYRGRRSPPITLPVVESTPAIYTLDASGKGQAAMPQRNRLLQFRPQPGATRHRNRTLRHWRGSDHSGRHRWRPLRARSRSRTPQAAPARIRYRGWHSSRGHLRRRSAACRGRITAGEFPHSGKCSGG